MQEDAVPVPQREEPVSFDLSLLATAIAKADLTIVNPGKIDPETKLPEPTDIRITCYSADNPAVKERVRRQFKTVLKTQREKRDEDMLDEVDENEMNVLVAATVGWHCSASKNSIRYGNNFLPCTPDNVRKVYTEVPVIAEQVLRFINARANFMKG